MSNVKALDSILIYIRLPSCKWTGTSYSRSEEVGISRWAAKEILEEVIANMNIPARQTVAEFYSRMIRYAQQSNNPNQKKIFRIAASAADEIGAML